MTDVLDRLPLPEGAPPPGGSVRLELPEPGLLHLVLDPPHRPRIAVLDAAVLRDLELALGEVEAEPDVRGLVVRGREPLSFAAGADVDAIASIEDSDDARALVRRVQGIFQRLWRLGRSGRGKLRTVAAVGGPVPGGAYELALACDRIVLAEDPRTRIGLPEVQLGILPAWGGSTRLPRRVGVPEALALVLAGRLVDARGARRRGMVDRTTRPEYLWRVADDVAAGRTKLARRRPPLWRRWLVDRNPLAGAVIASSARKRILRETRGRYPAPLAALPVVVRAPRVRIETSLAAEAEAVAPLATSPVTAALIELFRGTEDAKRHGRLPDGTEPARFRRAAVVGAGVMGGGIASLLAEKGLSVRLRDLDPAQLDAAVREHRREVERRLRRRRLRPNEARAAVDRLEPTVEATGLSRCDLALEAVAERLDVKRAVLGELAAALPPDAVLATNTSSLSVEALAEGVPAPERVVGLHFFNPVRRMRLVEVVRGPRTSDEVVARAARLALDLGKTPVVCRDVAGFLVNRLLGPYLDEAVRLVEEGVDPAEVDRALEEFGMVMGPCAVLDEVGLDVAGHAAASLEAAYGPRMAASGLLEPLRQRGDLGRKSGAGIYRWSRGRGGRLRRGAASEHLPSRERRELPADEVVDRTVLAMVNEAARALDERVVATPRELDLAMVLGTGFAPFRGGPLRHADARGPSAVVARLEELLALPAVASRPGGRARFEPAPLLRRLADGAGRFHEPSPPAASEADRLPERAPAP